MTKNMSIYEKMVMEMVMEIFIFWLTEYLSQTILWILVAYNLIWNLLETLYIHDQRKG